MHASIRVNGVEETLSTGTVLALLQSRGIDAAARCLAVAVNGAVLPRDRWETAALRPGDEVEIVRPFAGG
jgi:sulfur carrier protein